MTLLVFLGALTACDSSDIQVYRVAKERNAPPAAAAPKEAPSPELPPGHPPIGDLAGQSMTSPGMMGQGMSGSVPPPGPPAHDLEWDAPAEWINEGATGMRRASYKIKSESGAIADVSVIVLPGAVGGTLANVNRWRGQIRLGPTTEAELPSLLTKVKSAAGELLVCDFTAEQGQPKMRLVAGTLTQGEELWFFKMTGEEGVVGKAKEAFLGLLRSIRHAGRSA